MGKKQIRRVKNYSPAVSYPIPVGSQQARSGKNLNLRPVNQQFLRLRQDIGMWREAIGEAERPYYPFRVKMQRCYKDTVLNGHVFAAMERRRDLTLLRQFEFVQADDDTKTFDDLARVLKNQMWFRNFVSLVLDAQAYGYSLISLGDIVDSKVKRCGLVRRWYVSPDRRVVSSTFYSPGGESWDDRPYRDWHVYVDTPTETGESPCGYGYLYRVALYEILLRNNIGYNADFVELYSQPYRVGKTTKREGEEREAMEAAMRDMGSSGWAIIDPDDEISFLETNLGGTGWQGYDNLEQRCKKDISKIILGHPDALDSTPGKLGSQQGEDNPIAVALAAKQVVDGELVECIVNTELLPRLRNLGIPIPDNAVFRYKNNEEKERFREREDKSNKVTAEIAQTLSNAGLEMDPEYFTERTGIPVTKKAVEMPAGGPDGEEGEPDEGAEELDENEIEEEGEDDARNAEKVRNKIAAFYAKCDTPRNK